MESENTRGPVVRNGLILLRVALFALAAMALRRELHNVHPSGVLASVRAIGLSHILIAFAFVAASFLTLGVVELLAIRYAGRPALERISTMNALRTSFVATAFSQSIGFAVLTGTAVRARRYSAVDVSVADTARISGFVTITATLGLLAGAGITLLFASAPVVALGVRMPARTAGLFLLLPVAAYAAWSVFGAQELRLRSFCMRRPHLATVVLQVAISIADLCITALVLFTFIHAASAVGGWLFFRSYFVAQAIAVISHVPGGLGVFEAGLLTLLTAGGVQAAQAVSIAAAMLLFRIAYYLIPLVVAAAVA